MGGGGQYLIVMGGGGQYLIVIGTDSFTHENKVLPSTHEMRWVMGGIKGGGPKWVMGG